MSNNAQISDATHKILKRHFHSFDAFRFFAFLKVFLLHIPIIAFPWFNFLKAGGGIGVQFFFVLSGFLITYIICEEKKQTGSLNLKFFFVRRILRIWPLYYLMVAVAYLTPFLLSRIVHLPSSAEGYEPRLWISVLFLENYKMMLTHQHANASPLAVMWSLCVEEHFYIIWGLLLYYVKIKSLPKIIVFCTIAGIIFRALYVFYDIPTSDIFTNIDLFAYGAIPAYLLIEREEALQTYLGKISQFAKMCFVLFLLLAVQWSSQFEEDRSFIFLTSFLGILFSAMIMLTLADKSSIKIGDNNILSKIGIYTYGLYLYHTLVINLLLQIFRKSNWSLENDLYAVLFFISTLLLTVLCSILSYHFFEKYFLRLKQYFR